MSSTRLWLVRHGETDHNALGVFQGRGGVDLNARGRAQATRLAERLATQEFAACYGSDQPRARQTAEILLRHHPQLVPLWSRALRELYMGSWEGKTRAEVQAALPEEYRRWAAGEDIARGGGERYADGGARVSAALGEIAAAFPGASVLVVSHGAVLRAAIAERLSLSLAALGPLHNTALSILEIGCDGAAASCALLSYNDIAHEHMAPAGAETRGPAIG